MDTENGSFSRTEARFHLLIEAVKFTLCSIEGRLKTIAFCERVSWLIFYNECARLVLASNTNGHATRRAHTAEGFTGCLRHPTLRDSSGIRSLLLLWLIAKPARDGGA